MPTSGCWIFLAVLVRRKKLLYASKNHAIFELRLTRHLDEAVKAVALAGRFRIAHDVHDTLAQCLTRRFAGCRRFCKFFSISDSHYEPNNAAKTARRMPKTDEQK
jgi:hypothetical protein